MENKAVEQQATLEQFTSYQCCQCDPDSRLQCLYTGEASGKEVHRIQVTHTLNKQGHPSHPGLSTTHVSMRIQRQQRRQSVLQPDQPVQQNTYSNKHIQDISNTDMSEDRLWLVYLTSKNNNYVQTNQKQIAAEKHSCFCPALINWDQNCVNYPTHHVPHQHNLD